MIKKEIVFAKKFIDQQSKEELNEINPLMAENSNFIVQTLNSEDGNNLLNKKIENEKNSFKKYVFDLTQTLANLEYSFENKRIGINEFITDIILIKEKINSEKIISYQINRILSKNKDALETKNYMKTFYTDIYNQVEGLNTSIYVNLLLEKIASKKLIDTSVVKKVREDYIDICNEFILNSSIEKSKNIFNELKKNLNLYLKNSDFEIKFNNGASIENISEKVKYFGILGIEFFLILYPNLAKQFLYQEEKIKNMLKSVADKIENNSINVSKRAKEKYYRNSAQTKYQEKFNEEYNPKIINEYLNSRDINLEEKEKVIDGYLNIEFDNQKTIKDFLTYTYFSWLRLNDLLAEIKLYINLLDAPEIKLKSKKERNIKDKQNSREKYIVKFEKEKEIIYNKISLIKEIIGEENIELYRELLLSYQRIVLFARDYKPHIKMYLDINFSIFYMINDIIIKHHC